MDTAKPDLTFANLEAHLGHEIALSAWHRVPQEDATAFGHLTRDPDPMHIDPEWACAESPYGETVLAGFHMLSLLPFLTRGNGLSIGGVKLAMNYGFERIRFVSPIPVNAQFRDRVQLLRVDRRADGKATIVTHNSLEVRGADRPALVADWVNLLWPHATGV
jgi:acyl dehydratase